MLSDVTRSAFLDSVKVNLERQILSRQTFYVSWMFTNRLQANYCVTVFE